MAGVSVDMDVDVVAAMGGYAMETGKWVMGNGEWKWMWAPW